MAGLGANLVEGAHQDVGAQLPEDQIGAQKKEGQDEHGRHQADENIRNDELAPDAPEQLGGCPKHQNRKEDQTDPDAQVGQRSDSQACPAQGRHLGQDGEAHQPAEGYQRQEDTAEAGLEEKLRRARERGRKPRKPSSQYSGGHKTRSPSRIKHHAL